MFKKEDELSLMLKLYWYNGIHPQSRPWVRKCTMIMGLLTYISTFFMGLKGVLFYYHSDLFYALECLQTCILTFHIMGRHFFLLQQKQTLAKLLEEKSKFWEFYNFPEHIRRKSERILKISHRLCVHFLQFSIVLEIIFAIQPIFTGKLPLGIYITQGHHKMLYCFELPIAYFTYIASLTTDAFFMAICASIIVQFKLLAFKFENLKDWKQLKDLVDYHNLLLHFCHEVNQMFSGFFLLLFIFTIVAACMQIFIFMQDNFDLANRMKCLVYFAAQIGQCAIFCIGAELISDAAQEVGVACYQSHWYQSNDTKITKTLNLVIAKAQSKMVFSGYGIVYININTFTVIFKTAMSFYTYLTSIGS